MTIDEKDVEQRRPLYELLDKLGAELDKKRAEVRAAAGHLFDELTAALERGDLSAKTGAGKVYMLLAAHFDAGGCKGDAQTYRLNAAECKATLSRRTWVENHKKGKHRR